ncbi:MAG: PAS domain-containing protein [Rhodobacteraceae bacterium]|nr:PAS domain-containing protein [Paracoccaceae bacterium]
MAREMPPPDLAQDPAVLDRLTDDLVEGRSDTVCALFAHHGAACPSVVWRPSLVDVQHPILRSFLRACANSRGGPMPLSWIESDDFTALADWAMILEPVEGGADFIYRHYGPQIAQHYGRDMTGQKASDIGGHVALFFMALYRAALRRREVVKSIHEPPRQVFVRAWRRVLVPLEDHDGQIKAFAVANVPDNELRAGLEAMPEAVLVVDREGTVCYANRAACLLFDRGRGPKPGVSLHDFTGLDPILPDAPEDLILEGRLRVDRQMLMRDRVPTPVRVTCGATYYRDMPFFILTVRRD